jgi:hypothetical protein
MRTCIAIRRAVAVSALFLCSAGARAETADACAVPGYLLFGDSLIQRVTAAASRDKSLKIVVLGGASSSLPGPDGASYAYPARLEAALRRRLPHLTVSVVAHSRPRQPAAKAAEIIGKLLRDDRPSLVVWQTGTYDAVHGTDRAAFRDTLSDGIETMQAGGADTILMNMQFSPRTESVVAVDAYADSMRWVAREREVPLFDRLAIMRYWYDTGQFDLYAATKDIGMAKSVHDCIGRTLASLIIDAGRLESQRGTSAQ